MPKRIMFKTIQVKIVRSFQRMLFIIPSAMILGSVSLICQAAENNNLNSGMEQRIDHLLSQMTLQEKIGQMCQYRGGDYLLKSMDETNNNSIHEDIPSFYPHLSADDIANMVRHGEIGSFLMVLNPKEANYLQSLARQSRLKIPLLLGIDAIHGDGLVRGATVYPTPLTLASTFDLELAKKIGRQTAREVRTFGSQWVFSPNVDVVRDARWGRTGETFGEDPLLCGRMGAAMIQGYQNDGSYGPDSVLACVKHLVGGGMSAGGINASPTDVSERTLRTVLLPPFDDAFQAGAGSLMVAHNELNGIPCHANRWLIETLARKEGGFHGFVVSDYMDIEGLTYMHHVAANQKEAVFQAVTAGIDMHMQGPGFLKPLLELVQEGRIPESRIDESVRRILRSKFELGLFDPNQPATGTLSMTQKDEDEQTALQAAREGIVLLKNEDQLLPLDETHYSNILVAGPLIDSQAILGDWSYQQPASNIVTVIKGMKMIAPPSCHLTFYNAGGFVRKTSPQDIATTVTKAKAADLTVLVVGGNSLRYDSRDNTGGENVDRSYIDLPGEQLDLVKAVVATGKPVVVVMANGRPLASEWIMDHVPSILEAWEPGCRGGQALAEILFGKVNPSGRLPISIPRSVGQIPTYYNYMPSMYSRKYALNKTGALDWFGYGLSYTTFKYHNLKVPPQITPGEDVPVKIDVTNTGKRAGDEVVLAYVNDVVSSVETPVKSLKAFKRISLQPGETKSVDFKIGYDQLALLNQANQWVVEPGNFELMVGDQKSRFSVASKP